MVEMCALRSMRTINPIIDWSDEDVWEFIRKYDVPYCSLYDEGWKRLGCVLCPLGGHPQEEAERWPKIAKAYINTFDKLLEVRKAAEKTQRFKTGQELFDWWILRHTTKGPSEDQIRLFD